MRLITFVMAVCALCPQARAHVLKLKDGTVIQGHALSASTGSFRLEGGFTVPVRKTLQLHFMELEPVTSDYFQPLPESPGAAQQINAQAKKLGARYPQEQGLVLRDLTDITLRSDGSWFLRRHFTAKALAFSAAEDFKQFAEELDNGRERVKFRKATVYRPDGSAATLDPANLASTEPQAQDGMYSESAMLVYSFPEFSAGSALDVITEREVFSPFKKEFFFPRALRRTLYPVAEWRFSVTVPKNRNFFYSADRFTGEFARYAAPSVTRSSAAVTYTWRVKNLPPVIPERMMPPAMELYPAVKGALFKGWGPVFDWISPQYLERMTPDPRLAELALGLTAGASNRNEKIAALYHYVQKTIRYTAVKLGMSSNWAGYDVNLTWRRKYGCCIDKALLLAVMLKTAGVEAEPFVLNASNVQAHDFRLADMDFEHAVVRVRTDSGILFLDPTGNDYPYPYMAPENYSAGGIAPLSRTTDYTTPPPARENRTEYDYTVSVTPDLAEKISLTATYYGPTEGVQRAAFRELAPIERAHTVHEWLKQIAPSARAGRPRLSHLEDFDGHFSIQTSFSLDREIIEAGNLRIFTLPGFEQSFAEAGTQSRLYPLVYPVPEQIVYNYTITYPKDYDLEALQPPLELNNRFGSFTLKTEHERGLIRLTAVFTRTARRISAADYPQYRAFLNRISRISRDKIFFSLNLQ
ncbi:MAG: DUF3857 domain-containing protein [Elusimicrobiaceae bacterium]|nr:DUF3857 domain-containing protein [Elusimicrobiaceae bacterium]